MISVVEDAIQERIPLWYRIWMEVDDFQVDENEITQVRALRLLEIFLCTFDLVQHISLRKYLHKLSFKLMLTRNRLRGSIWTFQC